MKILALFGDYYHACALYHRSLLKTLENENAEIGAHHYPTEFDPASLQGKDVLVICREGCIPGQPFDQRWIDHATEEAIVEWVHRGGRLFVWHSGLASYEPNGPLHTLFGGHFKGHPPVHTFSLKVSNPDDPMAAGIEDYEMCDELYNFPMDRKLNVWLEGHSPQNGVQPVAWHHPAEKGTVAALTIAHLKDNLFHATTMEIVRRCVTGRV